MITFIMTARLDDVDPQAWLADVKGSAAPGSHTSSTRRCARRRRRVYEPAYAQ
jgi:hypothetical protein